MGSQQSTQMDESIKIFVDTTINKYKVAVFSKSYCPYCRRAKEIITGYPLKPGVLEVVEIEKRPDCSQIQAYLKSLTGASTVPRIFVNGAFVGGCDDLTKIHETGEFEQMLKECSAI
ncbi:glutaredoxin-1 protein-like protein [Dinothrombium tinctorium]|uniref:Glutaredoxin-1 n=1 Tax=Dinothrombium tinctorium TaxID=1965070 RepID=A0A443RBC3_9ACAR|nr:glutaredoxin-1 protein-like protein [Dinothrombium tinctorium]